MTDAISRRALMRSLEEAEQRALHDGEWPYTASVLAKAIVKVKEFVADLPALDVAPVVRCYECKYRCTQTCPMYHTEICLDDLDGFDSYDTDRTDDNGFCHLGARMDGDAHD